MKRIKKDAPWLFKTGIGGRTSASFTGPPGGVTDEQEEASRCVKGADADLRHCMSHHFHHPVRCTRRRSFLKRENKPLMIPARAVFVIPCVLDRFHGDGAVTKVELPCG